MAPKNKAATILTAMSGLVYEAGKDGKQGVLWAADNDLNPTLGNTADKGPGSINKFVYQNGAWQQDPTDGWTFTNNGQTKGGKQLHFKDGTGGVDSEGITLRTSGISPQHSRNSA